MSRYTHYLVVDREDSTVLAWFPKREKLAQERAALMARDTGHNLTEGYWSGNQWVQDGPQGLKDLLRF